MSENTINSNARASFEDTAKLLRKFALFLSVTRGSDQKFLPVKKLTFLVPEFSNSAEYVFFDRKQVYQLFRLRLIHNPAVQIDDINSTLLELLVNCLLYITNLLHDEKNDMQDVFQCFKDIRGCIYVFSTCPIVIDTSSCRNAICSWIGDLIKIITCADGVARNCPRHLKIFNVIKHILTFLAKCHKYFSVIIREVMRKFENVLLYYAINEEIAKYVATKAVVFEYLLWILKCTVIEASRYCPLDEISNRKDRQTLERLSRCLKIKCPSIIVGLIDEVLKYY